MVWILSTPAPDHGLQEIAARARERDPDHVALRIAERAEIHRHGLRPAEDEADTARRGRAREHDERQNDRAEGVDVLRRIQRHAPHHPRRVVAELPGGVAMRGFMHRDRENQRNRADRYELNDRIHGTEKSNSGAGKSGSAVCVKLIAVCCRNEGSACPRLLENTRKCRKMLPDRIQIRGKSVNFTGARPSAPDRMEVGPEARVEPILACEISEHRFGFGTLAQSIVWPQTFCLTCIPSCKPF